MDQPIGKTGMGEYNFTSHVCVNIKEMEATEGDMLVVLDGLGRNILEHLGQVELGITIRVFMRDHQKKVLGGISGTAFGSWVYVSLLWVEKSLRNQGYGTRLLTMLEGEARRIGCQNAHVDTYTFEAVTFYQKAGYEIFGELAEYPPGYSKVFLKKPLNN